MLTRSRETSTFRCDGAGVAAEADEGELEGSSLSEGPVLLGSQSSSAGLQYTFSMSLPVHFALKIALFLLSLGSGSQKLKPNFSLWKKGPVCPPQKPSACKVLHKPRLHLTDLPRATLEGE